jgi:putative transposase
MTKPRFKDKYRIESTRLPDRNYAANGWYFVTICTRDRVNFFGEIIAGEIHLSAIGKTAQQFWQDIPNHFLYTNIDSYTIMPNHIHGIIVIDRPQNPSNHVETLQCVETLHCNVSTKHQLSKREFMSAISPNLGSLGAIVRSYKSAVTRWCRQNNCDHFSWQSRFYEHIIRADGSLDGVRQYIVENPAKWELDKENPANLWM